MDIEKISSIIDLIKTATLAEFELTEGDTKLRIVSASIAPLASTTIVDSTAASNYMTSLPYSPPSLTKEITSVSTDIIINSPMVGSFYIAASPTAEPFIKIGAEIKIGQVLCIIEAMKLMNQIEAECSGIVKDILATNAQAVEYGQPLIVLSPLKK